MAIQIRISYRSTTALVTVTNNGTLSDTCYVISNCSSTGHLSAGICSGVRTIYKPTCSLYTNQSMTSSIYGCITCRHDSARFLNIIKVQIVDTITQRHDLAGFNSMMFRHIKVH